MRAYLRGMAERERLLASGDELAALRAVAEAARRARTTLETWRYSRGACPACHSGVHRADCPITIIAGDLFASLAALDAAKRPAAVSADATVASPSAQADAVTKVGVTALVRDSAGRVLLGLKGRAFSQEFTGKWVTPGGRVNYGEFLEPAICREVHEETGLIVGLRGAREPRQIVHDHGHYVFFVYDAYPIDGILRAGDDLSDVRWFDRAALVAARDAMTPITREIVDDYLAPADTEPVAGDAPTASQRDAGEGEELAALRAVLAQFTTRRDEQSVKFRDRTPNQMIRWTFDAECPGCGATTTYDYKTVKVDLT